MLKEADKARLEEVLQIIKNKKLRFANAEVVEKTGWDKGNVSSFLNGKKPMPDDFYTTFIQAFGSNEVTVKNTDLNKELGLINSRLLWIEAELETYEEEIARLQSQSKSELSGKIKALRAKVSTAYDRRSSEPQTKP